MHDKRILSLAGVAEAKVHRKRGAARRVLTEGKGDVVYVTVLTLGDDPKSPLIMVNATEEEAWLSAAELAAETEHNGANPDEDDEEFYEQHPDEIEKQTQEMASRGHEGISAALEKAGYDYQTIAAKQTVGA